MLVPSGKTVIIDNDSAKLSNVNENINEIRRMQILNSLLKVVTLIAKEATVTSHQAHNRVTMSQKNCDVTVRLLADYSDVINYNWCNIYVYTII